MDDLMILRRQALKARRSADAATDPRVQAALEEFAEDCEARAARLERKADDESALGALARIWGFGSLANG